jgi:hypothetical protein
MVLKPPSSTKFISKSPILTARGALDKNYQNTIEHKQQTSFNSQQLKQFRMKNYSKLVREMY